jgi:peptide/nickel transport system substrate-binding protein
VTSTYDRRQFLTHSAAAAGGVVAAGALAGELAVADEAGAVTKGGTIIMGVISEQSQPFNPAYAHMDTSGFCYGRAIFDPLMVVSANGKTVYPYLAASLKPNATYTAWTITARKGVKFHNSNVCDAKAIYENLQECYSSYLTGPAVKALISGFTHTPGSNTVVVHTKHKWVTFPFTLAEQQIAFIAEPSTIGSGYSGHPIGTGPFVFNQWVVGTKFVTTKNSQYWRAGLPYLDQLEFHPIVSGQTRMQALQTGTVDIIHEAEGDVLSTWHSTINNSSYTYEIDYPGRPVYSPSSNCMMLNTGVAPLNNINLRRGCAYAINRSLFVSTIDSNFSVPIDGIFLPGSPYYKKPPYPAYSLAKAKALIAKVPPSQRTFTLTWVQGAPAVQAAATLAQTLLGLAGVTVHLASVTQANLITLAVTGNYQALTWAQFGGVSPDLNHPWFATPAPKGWKRNDLFGPTWLNFAENNDPKIETLMLAGMASTSAAGQHNAWAAVNIRLAQDVPYLWTDRTVLGVAAKSYVMNWKTFTDPSNHAILQPNQAVLFFTQVWKS